jgi:hypothetical protein
VLTSVGTHRATTEGHPCPMDPVTQVPTPVNEPVHGYAPGSPERAQLEAKPRELAENPIDLTCTIGGSRRMGGGERFDADGRRQRSTPTRRSQ